MKPTVYSKKAKQLPNRAALHSLDRSQRTINDYAKVTPIREDEPVATVVQNLRKK